MCRTFVLYVYHIIDNSQRQVLFSNICSQSHICFSCCYSITILFDWNRTRRTVYGSPKDALPLGSKRNGTKLESCFATLNLAKCRRFPTVLMTTVYYPTLCIDYNSGLMSLATNSILTPATYPLSNTEKTLDNIQTIPLQYPAQREDNILRSP